MPRLVTPQAYNGELGCTWQN